MNKVIVHHSGGRDDGNRCNWGDIRRYHIEHNGWLTIGYHAGTELINGEYEVLMGRPWDMQGAHCIGQNDKALGICFVGNWMDCPPPEEQLKAGATLIKLWMRLYGIGIENVRAHRDFWNTNCPGRMFSMDRLKEYLR